MSEPFEIRHHDGVWQVHGGNGWRPVRDALVVAILDMWPGAVVRLMETA